MLSSPKDKRKVWGKLVKAFLGKIQRTEVKFVMHISGA